MASRKPVIHGRDHRPKGFYGADDPGGADPIPGLVGSGGAASYPAGVLALSDLLAYWPLTEGAPTYHDLSGLANPADMTISGSSPTMTQDYTPGPLAIDDQGAVAFGGPGASAQFLGSGASSGSRFNSPRTISFWIKPLANATTFQGPVISNVSSDIFGLFGWKAYVVWPARDVTLFLSPGGGGSGQTFSGGVVPAAAWIHVVMTTGTTNRIYYNAALVASSAGAVSLPGLNAIPTIGLGQVSSGPPVFDSFDGGVAHVALWSRALTPSEIFYLYMSGNVAQAGDVFVSDGAGGLIPAPPTTVYVNGA